MKNFDTLKEKLIFSANTDWINPRAKVMRRATIGVIKYTYVLYELAPNVKFKHPSWGGSAAPDQPFPTQKYIGLAGVNTEVQTVV